MAVHGAWRSSSNSERPGKGRGVRVRRRPGMAAAMARHTGGSATGRPDHHRHRPAPAVLFRRRNSAGARQGSRLQRWVAILISPHNSFSSGARRARHGPALWSPAVAVAVGPTFVLYLHCLHLLWTELPVVSSNIFYSEHMTVFVHSMFASTLLS